MYLDVSRDGTQLAWSNFEHETIDVFAVSVDEEGVRVEKIDSLPGAAITPVFSPDGKYLAVVAVESAEAPLDSRVVAIELQSGERAILSKLTQFDPTSTLLTDWLLP